MPHEDLSLFRLFHCPNFRFDLISKLFSKSLKKDILKTVFEKQKREINNKEKQLKSFN